MKPVGGEETPVVTADEVKSEEPRGIIVVAEAVAIEEEAEGEVHAQHAEVVAEDTAVATAEEVVEDGE